MLTRDKEFYRSFFSLSIALMLQNIIAISVNLADNIMLGGYSENALSGAAAVNQIQFIFQQLLTAVCEGIVIIGSQYWGKKKPDAVKKITSTGLRLGLLISVILFLLVSLFPFPVLFLFTNNEAIIREGVHYLGIIRFSYLFFAVTMIMEAVLRCAEMVRISLCLSVMTFSINCSINYILIYGKFGAPQLGMLGAAIGTLTARIIECIMVLIYAGKRSHRFHFTLKDLCRENRQLRGDYLQAISSMLVMQGLWGLSNALQTVILGHLSDSSIAASSISSTLYLLLKSMAVGAASAAAVIIGKTVGEARKDMAKEYAKTMQILFLMIGIVSGTVLFFLRIPVLKLYDLSGETRSLANTFLILQSLVCVGMSYQMPVNNGIIRGGGSPQFGVRLDLVSIWGIVLPLSFFMAFVAKASPVVVFCCLNADQIFKCIPSAIKVNRGNWIRDLTRTTE